MTAKIEFTAVFHDDLKRLKKEDKKLLIKLLELIADTSSNPFDGLGQPEQLKHNFSGMWSRRISQKHRLTYKFDEEKEIIYLPSCYGHYNDK